MTGGTTTDGRLDEARRLASRRCVGDGVMGDLKRRRDLLFVVLTLVTGATDAIGFVKLGGVFTSVMTGNMVLVGVAIGKGEGALAIHTGVAFGGYIVGSFAGAAIARRAEHDESLWPMAFNLALAVELALFVAFAIGWELTGSHPSGDETLWLLALNAVALGIQSSAVLSLAVSGLSTTYLTGTLTAVVADVARGRLRPGSARSIGILGALIAGAALGAGVATTTPSAAPAVVLGLLAPVIIGGAFGFPRRSVAEVS